MQPFEYHGNWWLPDSPDKIVPGTLIFHPIEGISLNLYGTFSVSDENSAALFKVNSYPLILGVSRAAQPITLYKCLGIGTTGFIPASDYAAFTSKIKVNYIFVGHHFVEEKNILFKNMDVNLTYLKDWIRISGIQWQIIDENDKRKHLIEYTRPESIDINLNEVKFQFSHETWFKPQNFSYAVDEDIWIEITPTSKTSFSDFLTYYLYNLRNFLAFAVNRPVYPIALKGTCSDIEKTVDIFYQVDYMPPAQKLSLQSEQMLFRYLDIADHLETCLENWFAKIEALDPIKELYFAILYNPSLSTSAQFLFLAQALEAYHRRVHGGGYMTLEQYASTYKELVNAITKSLDRSHKDSLKGRIKYGYEYSFAKRLNLVITEVLKDYADLIGQKIDNNKKFVDKVRSTRNYLTHFGSEETPRDTPIKDLIELDQFKLRMLFLLQLCFFVELTIPAETVRSVVSNYLLWNPWPEYYR